MDNKNRILFVATFPPPIHGSSIVSQYIKDSKIINNSFCCDYINLSTSRKMSEIGKKSIIKIYRFTISFVSLFWKLLIHKYDICYLAITCRGKGFLKDAPFVLLCKLFCKNVVIHQHNKGMSKFVDKQPYKCLLPIVYRNVKVILLSWYLYEDVSAIISKRQVYICPNGIPNSFSEEPHFIRNNMIPHVLFLSNLITTKGVFVLLKALSILKDKGFNFICDFVGEETKDISKKEFLDEVNNYGLENYVFYHGSKYGRDKLDYYLKADIFVQPTFEDCFPLTIIEAMQYKLPIISTLEGAIPDMVNEDCGFLCERNDVNSLVVNLEKLLINKELRVQMGECAYKIYKNKFSLNSFENKMLEILKKIVLGNHEC